MMPRLTSWRSILGRSSGETQLRHQEILEFASWIILTETGRSRLGGRSNRSSPVGQRMTFGQGDQMRSLQSGMIVILRAVASPVTIAMSIAPLRSAVTRRVRDLSTMPSSICGNRCLKSTTSRVNCRPTAMYKSRLTADRPRRGRCWLHVDERIHLFQN